MSATHKASLVANNLQSVLVERAEEIYGEAATVQNLTRLSGGASRETWSFDVVSADKTRIPLVLKRDPVFYGSDGSLKTEGSRLGVDRLVEGRLMELAGEAGVPVPDVPFYLYADDRTTSGYVMQRLEGEALGRRLLREEQYASAREHLAFEAGHAAARLHSIPMAELPELKSMPVIEALSYYRDRMNSVDHPYPGFEYGFRWLEERVELAGERHGLVHGDFRNGNLLVGQDGLRGVLDWESAHVGNPITDLGWICVRSWRYGHIKKPVGGFGEVSQLQEGYEAGGGGKVSRETIHFWEVYGTAYWGVLCITMGFSHINGPHSSIEKAVIGRRSAETEYDLLQLVD